jgi:flavin-dependent dehydrogenase
MSTQEWDVVVVGANLAGFAATRVAQQNKHKVLVLERGTSTRFIAGSAIISLETGRMIEEKFQIPISACLQKNGYIKGVKYHNGESPALTCPFSIPAYHTDRNKVQRHLLTSLKDTPALFRSSVTSIERKDDHSVITAVREGQDWTFRCRAVVNASGRQILGLPTDHAAPHWSGQQHPATHFVARVALQATLPDPGWHEVFLGKNYLAFFRSLGEQMIVELTLPTARRWPEVWREFLGYLTGALKVPVFGEISSQFCWESRLHRWNLGSDAMLNVGSAGGLNSLLGYGIKNAVKSGFAAGRAIDFVGLTPDALTVYKKGIAEMQTKIQDEWTHKAVKRGRWIIGPDQMTFRELVKDLSPWRRWNFLRQAHSRLNLLLKPNPSTAQLPNRTR